MRRTSVAKDRNRHARIREPKQESLLDVAAQGAMQAIYDVSCAAVVGIGDFCYAVTDCLLDLAKKMEEAKNGIR